MECTLFERIHLGRALCALFKFRYVSRAKTARVRLEIQIVVVALLHFDRFFECVIFADHRPARFFSVSFQGLAPEARWLKFEPSTKPSRMWKALVSCIIRHSMLSHQHGVGRDFAREGIEEK